MTSCHVDDLTNATPYYLKVDAGLSRVFWIVRSLGRGDGTLPPPLIIGLGDLEGEAKGKGERGKSEKVPGVDQFRPLEPVPLPTYSLFHISVRTQLTCMRRGEEAGPWTTNCTGYETHYTI